MLVGFFLVHHFNTKPAKRLTKLFRYIFCIHISNEKKMYISGICITKIALKIIFKKKPSAFNEFMII